MENRHTKIKSIVIIVLAWLIALSLLYVVWLKVRLLFK
jgi:hypothetical protein